MSPALPNILKPRNINCPKPTKLPPQILILLPLVSPNLTYSVSESEHMEIGDTNNLPVDIGHTTTAITENSGRQSNVIRVYPLSNYYFGSKLALPFKNETISDRVLRMKSRYDVYGLRICVEAVILVELLKHPHLLLLQVRNSTYKLPGGRLRPGESDIDGLRRKLSNKLSEHCDGSGSDWEVGECLSEWWRSDFETSFYPYLPPNVKSPKECRKLFLVKLPESRKFIVPKNQKLLAVPLFELHDKTYGPIISGVSQMLSKFFINIVDL